MKKTMPSLRSFVDLVEQEIQPLDHKTLTWLFVTMAKEVKVHNRQAYLGRLRDVLETKQGAGGKARGEGVEATLARIKQLQKEIEARIDSIDDGSYWYDTDREDWEEDDDYYHDDEGPDFISENQTFALLEFFDEADQYFFRGEKENSLRIYTALFKLIDEVADDYSLHKLDFDSKEARARYIRCVYEVTSKKDRPKAMLEVMGVWTPRSYDFIPEPTNYPMLVDVFEADNSTLEDSTSFLSAWEKILSKQSSKVDRVAELLLEAAYLKGGVEAVGELAQKWKGNQPKGYLRLLEYLKGDGEDELLLEKAREAIACLPEGRTRYKAATFLIEAGTKLKSGADVLEGYRQQFRSEPHDTSLLNLVVEAERQGARESELKNICTYCSDLLHEYQEDRLLVMAYLMSGEFGLAFDVCKEGKSLGWSHGATGLFFFAAQYLLRQGNEDCTVTDDFLDEYSHDGVFSFSRFENFEHQAITSNYIEITKGLDVVDHSKIDRQELQKWVTTIGKQRINSIVSNKYRRAYDRAAGVLVSLAEIQAANNKLDNAKAILKKFCKEKYNRHSAFKNEVRAVLELSDILKGVDIGL